MQYLIHKMCPARRGQRGQIKHLSGPSGCIRRCFTHEVFYGKLVCCRCLTCSGSVKNCVLDVHFDKQTDVCSITAGFISRWPRPEDTPLLVDCHFLVDADMMWGCQEGCVNTCIYTWTAARYVPLWPSNGTATMSNPFFLLESISALKALLNTRKIQI